MSDFSCETNDSFSRDNLIDVPKISTSTIIPLNTQISLSIPVVYQERLTRRRCCKKSQFKKIFLGISISISAALTVSAPVLYWALGGDF